jgi:hypothetical protein
MRKGKEKRQKWELMEYQSMLAGGSNHAFNGRIRG